MMAFGKPNDVAFDAFILGVLIAAQGSGAVTAFQLLRDVAEGRAKVPIPYEDLPADMREMFERDLPEKQAKNQELASRIIRAWDESLPPGLRPGSRE